MGLALLLIMSCSQQVSAETGMLALPSFGKGKTQVRLYTDYFCGPCSRMEPKVESLLERLVKKGTITLTFIDTPVHKETVLYAKYFLYILNVDRSLGPALQSRGIMFKAAQNKIGDPEKLEEFLARHNVRYKQTDIGGVLTALSALINEDSITSTPTCVIVNGGRKSSHSGETDIARALELLDRPVDPPPSSTKGP